MILVKIKVLIYERDSVFVDSYINNYFDGCYYKKTNMISTVVSIKVVGKVGFEPTTDEI